MGIKLCNKAPNHIKEVDKTKFFTKRAFTTYIPFSRRIYVMFNVVDISLQIEEYLTSCPVLIYILLV